MAKKINQFKMNKNPYPTDIDFKIKQHTMKKDADYIATTDYSEVRTAAEALKVKEWEVLRVIDLLGTNKRTEVYKYFNEGIEAPIEPNNVLKLALNPEVTQYTPEQLLEMYHNQPTQYLNTPMRNKHNVLDWAEAKGLLKPENRFVQFAKVVSEVGELGDAMIKDNKDEEVDSLGDVLVTLIILSEQLGYDIEDCLESAYQVIKNRTGTTNSNGSFIKD